MVVTETPFLTRQELAARWGISTRTLENWSRTGKGPGFRRFGHRAMYRLTDVVAYEAQVWGTDAASQVSA